jgi:dephospho-CoA kinase
VNPHKTQQPIIGLVGGIGSGKSTVAATLATLGCGVVDADRIARDLLSEVPIQQKLAHLFGQDTVTPDGKVDRARLAQIVFHNPDQLEQLDTLLHPRILQTCEQQIETYRQMPEIQAIVLDMPLLVEVGWDKHCDHIIAIVSDWAVRLERGKKKGLDASALKLREKFQISLDKKVALADNRVVNNSDLSSLVRQVTEIFSNIVINN